MNQSKKKSNPDSKSNPPSSWLLYGGLLIILYFNPNFRDPFNSPKLCLLMIYSAWLIGYLVTASRENFRNKKIQIPLIILSLFAIFYFIAALLTDVKFTAFFGENQRRTGFATYLSLTIIMITSVLFMNYQSINKLFTVTFMISLALTSYAYFQTTGQDFVKWNNPYNSIISTLGNPNYAAAAMAVFSVFLFGNLLIPQRKSIYKILSLLLLIFSILMIIKSESRQGLLAFAVGALVIISVFIKARNRILGLIVILFSGLLGICSILGMLQIGPLAKYLYKGSVTVRGFYWDAGVKMFLDNPIFGVGVDRFGAFFKSYREPEYPLKYGFNITSTNAHNVFVQHFATAGLFVGTLYLAIVGYIFIVGVRSLRNSDIRVKQINATIFGAWLAFQSQSFISIDNIGLTYWGWLLGGTILALNNEEKINFSIRRTNNIDLKRISISTIFVLPAIVLSILFYRFETSMQNELKWYNPAAPDNKTFFLEAANRTLNSPILEPYYRLDTGAYLAAMGYSDLGLKTLKAQLIKDPINIDNLQILAAFSEQLNNNKDVVNYREQILKVDPWNADNLLKLGVAYKNLGNFSAMEEALRLIESFAENTEEAKNARKILISD